MFSLDFFKENKIMMIVVYVLMISVLTGLGLCVKFNHDYRTMRCESPSDFSKCWNLEGKTAPFNKMGMISRLSVTPIIVSYDRPLDVENERRLKNLYLNGMIDSMN